MIMRAKLGPGDAGLNFLNFVALAMYIVRLFPRFAYSLLHSAYQIYTSCNFSECLVG